MAWRVTWTPFCCIHWTTSCPSAFWTGLFIPQLLTVWAADSDSQSPSPGITLCWRKSPFPSLHGSCPLPCSPSHPVILGDPFTSTQDEADKSLWLPRSPAWLRLLGRGCPALLLTLPLLFLSLATPQSTPCTKIFIPQLVSEVLKLVTIVLLRHVSIPVDSIKIPKRFQQISAKKNQTDHIV